MDQLARRSNVAQFVSFGPTLDQRFSWVHGFEPNHVFDSLEVAVKALLHASPESSLNVRSFEPRNPKSREFLYGLDGAAEVAKEIRRLAASGMFTIVNETVDVEDGGVSGVAFGQVIEFAPGDTPRCVEKPGTAALPRDLGCKIFRTVYGFEPSLPEDTTLRVEFSLHPLRRGYRHDHTIIWEVEEAGLPPSTVEIGWPHRFSRLVGDKAFGLLIAHLMDLPVPHTMVIPRALAPFAFGRDTGLAEPWIRTCPTEQVPGFFSTQRGWRDPYQLMQEEDPQGHQIASLLRQQGVNAQFSGALVTQADGEVLLEGVSGHGDAFMAGRQPPEDLPQAVISRVRAVYKQASATVGPVRCEWVDDGTTVWIVQLHRGASTAMGRVIYPGEASRYHYFNVSQGLEQLRDLIAKVQGTGEGIVLLGQVGVTSHFGDVLRRAAIPSRIERRELEPTRTN